MLYVAFPVMLVISSMKLVQSQENCIPFYALSNFKLTGHIVKTINSPSRDHCIDECKAHTKCHSLNYRYDVGFCELSNANHLNQPASLVPGNGYQYVSYHHRKPETDCSNKHCGSKVDVCVIDSSGEDYNCVSCTGGHAFQTESSQVFI